MPVRGVKGPRGKYRETGARALAHTTHGESRGTDGRCTPEYKAWAHIRQRCLNPKTKNFANYGGRGITVCARWQSYESFLADMGRKPSPAHEIDRIDNNGNYGPDNCRWALDETQAKNKRNNVVLTYNGKTQVLEVWAREVGIDSRLISYRLKHGHSLERALNPKKIPSKGHGFRLTLDEVRQLKSRYDSGEKLKHIAKEINMDYWNLSKNFRRLESN